MAILRGDSVVFTVDSVDYTCDAKSIVVTPEEDDDASTFCGKAYTWSMAIAGVQKDDEDAFFSFLWDNGGDVVDWTMKTNGTVGRTFSGKVRIPEAIEFGGEHHSVWGFDIELEVPEKPVRSALPVGP